MLENELAFRAKQRGIKATVSHDVFIQTFSKEDMPEKETIISTIQETGSETIFTVSLLDKETSTRYVPGTTTYYAPYGYGYAHYGGFYGYYSAVYPVVYDPGYYTTDKTYYIESNLYDAKTEKLLWSAQSQTLNPSDLEQFTNDYANALNAWNTGGSERQQACLNITRQVHLALLGAPASGDVAQENEPPTRPPSFA